MQVQINTDRNIEHNERLTKQVEAALSDIGKRFGEQITRLEVHLSDVNSGKGGEDDKRCLIEARLAGLQPTAVSHQAPSLDLAIDGATEKLKAALERTRGRLGSATTSTPRSGRLDEE